jgi:hypothetical protein
MSKINYLILFKLTTSILNFGRMLAGRVQQKDQAVTKRMMSGDWEGKREVAAEVVMEEQVGVT